MSALIKTYPQWLAPALFALALAGCEGSSDDGFSLGGTVTGPAGNGFELTHKDETIIVAGKSFTFKQRLADGDAYNVRLTQDPNQQLCQLANASGRVSGRDVKDIEVRCRGWRGAQSRVDNNGPYSDEFNIAMDAAGNGLAVWVSASSGTTLAQYYSVVTQDWGPVESLGEGDEELGTPQIVFDADGNALVIWSDNNEVLQSRRYLAAEGDWEDQTVRISNLGDDLGGVASQRLVMDGQGNAIAVWRQFIIDDDYRLFANHFSADTQQWDSDATLLATTAGVNSPDIAITPAGDALLVWIQASTGELLARHYSVEAAEEDAWGEPELIAEVNGTANGQSIAFHPQGDALLVWHMNIDAGSNTTSILASRYSASTKDAPWSEPERLETQPGKANFPQLGLDAKGNALAVWQQVLDDGSGQFRSSILASRYSHSDQRWSEPETLETEAGAAEFPELVVDAQGNALVVWMQDDDLEGLNNSVHANRYSAASGWGKALLLESSSSGAQHPKVALSPAGNAIAAWQTSKGNQGLATNDFR